MNKIVVTCGDINGIGPEIVIKAIKLLSDVDKLIYCCPKNIFFESSKFIDINFKYEIFDDIESLEKSEARICILDIGDADVTYGNPSKISGEVSYKSITKALDLVDAKIADAIITAPISKMALKLAGVDFPGHTEMLGARYNLNDFKMMFLSDIMKCALVTIHEKISDVPKLIDKNKLSETIETVLKTLSKDLSNKNPQIAVLGLNPHAGEEGKIGSEEIEIMNPIIEKYSDVCFGPFVPDAFFGMQLYKKFDMVIGMYHDQVLIPFKLLNFDKGVNYTAGLPIVRTSPDHGTAFDIAGKGIAKPDSIVEAVKWALKIVKSRESNI